MDLTALDHRSREILRYTVHLFITTGEPIGSRTLSRVTTQGLSPATIRNIMADLEEMGYLYQPHTSAGRVPTDKGYRFYVGTIMDGDGLGATERKLIYEQMRPAEGGVSELVQRTSRLLSTMTGMVGFVIGPDFRLSVLRHVDFIRLGPTRLLVVLVSASGQVSNRVVEIAEELSGEDLEQCARYLEDQFRGYTLVEAHELLVLRMQEIAAVVNVLVRNALTIAEAAFAGQRTSEVHVEGTARILAEPEFIRNIERAQQLFETLEQRQRLVNILNACLEGNGLQIVIGSEARVPDLEGLSLIGARYTDGNQELGSIGIMGPTRMAYARHISVVDYVACSLSQAITEVGERELNH
ncbi:MAG TPA: heat-inducible transcriptional repressor HrcA [Vicinamibacteria bacterium]|nr:heat-inducible transcriptional repressor HrcA [Vicinamibacteria bacterium]